MELNIYFREETNLIKVFHKGEIDTFTAPKLRNKLESIKITSKSINRIRFIESCIYG
ncbi:Anti-sigma factor antagonist OS=Ureibacillus acetophenoni OX=614649 GN=SAMN05877842_111150 PE=3 SV=1 [Ureibacillus acetophenoni]